MNILKVHLPIFILLFVTQGCLDLRSCPNKIAGRYYCNNNPTAVNFLQINSDGTFLHIFKLNDIKLSDSGTWERSKKSNCILELSSWKSFNQFGPHFKEYGNGILWLNGEYIDIGPDGESSTSFKKMGS